MKQRAVVIGLLVLLLGSLLLPFFTVYPHKDLPQEIAASFPGDVTGLQLLLKGTDVLPVSLMPSLSSILFREGLLAGVLLSVAGALLALLWRRGFAHMAALMGCAGVLLLFLFAFYAQQLDNSMLFSVMLTAKWFLWLGFVAAAALFGMELWLLKGLKPLIPSDRHLRYISAGLGALALLILLLPFVQTYVPAGTFATPAEDALASRSLSGWQWMTGGEPLLRDLAAGEGGGFSNPAGAGAMQSLVTLSGSTKDVQNLFMIPTNNGGSRNLAIAACALLLLAMVLQLIRRVDRWVPACLTLLAGVMLAVEAVGTLAVDASYQFMGAAYQLLFLGLGGYTAAPLFMAALACGAAVSAILGIRYANEPYFVNPIPQKKRLLVVSVFLAAASVILLLTPVMQVNLYTPGKINQASPTVSQPMSGASLLSFQKPGALMQPVNARGKLLYKDEPAANGRTSADLAATVTAALNKMSAAYLCALGLAIASLTLLLLKRRNKRLIVASLLSSGVVQALALFAAMGALPADVGFVSGLGPLYISMGASAFSAFFAGFLNYEELPKKFKLFLMLLPFLVAVLLFAYLPLSGWRYAFYDYKLGLPMSEQAFVGFKWFTTMFSSPAQQAEVVRVLRNTFGMSGLGLATSWMPVAFAIFLTEIRSGWFKKFVQIFTTLPNFISWVLVFSFALTIFSMDTGIVNRILLNLNLIKEPVAYLNSGEHIWLKMWLWNTWKTLGWGAIMYLAAIAGIDQELYEAAKVDGAGRWRQIYHITIPGLLPTFFVLLLLAISNVVNNGMEQYLVFQNAMNKSTIEVLDLYVFNISLGTRSTNTISMATAIGILKSLVSIVLLFMANSFSKLVRGESIV